MRVFGLALAGVLALTTPIPAYADQPGPKMRPTGPAPAIAQGPAMVRAGTRHPVVGSVAGTRTPVIRSNGVGVGLARVGHRAVIMVCGVRLERGAAPTLYGEAPTFPTAATVTGARYGIPTQNGEGLPGAGVTPNGLG
jgi:hypothetical protein